MKTFIANRDFKVVKSTNLVMFMLYHDSVRNLNTEYFKVYIDKIK